MTPLSQPTTGKTPLPDAAKEFLVDEAKQRRKEVEDILGRMEGDQKHSLIVMGAYWAWLATNTKSLVDPLTYVAVLLPTVVMCFFLFRFFVFVALMMRVAEYIEMIEHLFDLPDGYGWEKHLREQRGTRKIEKWLRSSSISYWIALIVLNLSIAVLFLLFR